MTDPRTGQPEWSPSEQTIPMVPDSGYDQPDLPPLPEETLIDPLGPRDPWASGPGLGEDASQHNRPAAPPPAPAATTPVMPFGTPADYARSASATTPPAAQTSWPPSSPQPAWGQPAPQPAWGQPAPQPAWGQPAPQPAWGQPAASPVPAPQRTWAQPGFPEPEGPAASLPAPPYPTYASSGYAGQAWPGALDPVNHDYGYAGSPTSPHPNAVPSMVLGILGLVFFPLASPVAWYLAARGRRQMRYDPGRWAPSGMLTAGLVTGIIGTAFLAIGALFLLVALGIFLRA